MALAALGLLVAELLGARGFHRIEAEAYAGNLAGIRAFTAAGFRTEGVRRRVWWRDGDWRDGVLLGLVAEDLDADGGVAEPRRR